MQRVLITGAGRGLGLALTREVLARGDQVFAGCRSPAREAGLAQLAAEHPGRLEMLPLDVADQASIDASWQAVRDRVDGLDLLINNAGVNSMSSGDDPAVHLRLGRLDPDRMLGMFRVNAIAPLMMVQRYLDLLQAGQAPCVINLSSWLGSIADKQSGGNYSYCASKAALNMLTRTLAFDLIRAGITVVAVNPGWMRTDMGGPRASLAPEESARGILALARSLTPAHTGRFFDWNGEEHPW